jgi:hypothetical protein
VKRRDLFIGLGGMAATAAALPLAKLAAHAPPAPEPAVPPTLPRTASYRIENVNGRLMVYVAASDGTKLMHMGDFVLLDGDTLTLDSAITLSIV